MEINKIINIPGFQFKHLFRRGLYRLIWFGFLAQFGIVATTKDENSEQLLSIGTFSPLSIYFDKGYNIYCAGWVLGFPIIIYKNDN